MYGSVSFSGSTLGGCLTLTAVIHASRSSRGKLLHSRRTEGFEQVVGILVVSAAIDGPSRVVAARASFTNRERDIPRDDRGTVWEQSVAGREKERKEPDEVQPGS